MTLKNPAISLPSWEGAGGVFLSAGLENQTAEQLKR